MSIEIGRTHQLTVQTLTSEGALLTDGEQSVLLPRRWAADKIREGDSLEVFVLTDARGDPLATTERPFACVGEVKYLKVTEQTSHGTFVDWGLSKELLVPFAEQQAPLEPGSRHLIAVQLDKRGERIIGSTRLSRILEEDAGDVASGQEVGVIVHRFTDLGAVVVVDHRRWGVIHHSDLPTELSVGQELVGYVKRVTLDHHLDIALKPPGAAGRDRDVQAILDALQAAGGQLALHDKSSPEAIAKTLNMSKKAFKRAVGKLYKQRAVALTPAGIRLLTNGVDA